MKPIETYADPLKPRPLHPGDVVAVVVSVRILVVVKVELVVVTEEVVSVIEDVWRSIISTKKWG